MKLNDPRPTRYPWLWGIVVLLAILMADPALAGTCPAGTYGSAPPNCTVTPAGTYAPAGSDSPIPSPAGYYIPYTGSTSISAAIAVQPGYFSTAVGASSATAATPCPGGSTSYGGASLCRLTSASGTFGTTGLLSETLANGGGFGTVETNSSVSTVLTLSDVALSAANGLHITDLSLLNISIIGGDGAFSLASNLNGTVLQNGGATQLGIIFDPTNVGSYSATLSITTDAYADFGTAGKVYQLALTGSAVPEPGSWELITLGFGGIGSMLRRRGRPDAALGIHANVS